MSARVSPGRLGGRNPAGMVIDPAGLTRILSARLKISLLTLDRNSDEG
jgi:hypothetical protein